jgi:hypothetical protein
VLPPLGTLVAYTTQKSFISLGEYSENRIDPFFTKAFPFWGKKGRNFGGKEVVSPFWGKIGLYHSHCVYTGYNISAK